MGQVISCQCPCKNRKDMQDRLNKSKYDAETSDGSRDLENPGSLLAPDRIAKIKESEKLQEIINRRDPERQSNDSKEESESEIEVPLIASKRGSTLDPSKRGSVLSPATNDSDRTIDVIDEDIDIMFLGIQVESMANAMNDVSAQYGHMIPYVIVPHPSENKAVIALKYVEAQTDNDKPIHYKIFHFEKDLKSLNNNISFGVLEDFFKQQYMAGLDFLGYYLDFDYKYHLIFSNIGAKRERTHLDFQKLNDTSLKEIKNTLKKKASAGYQFKGMVTLIETYETPKPLTFMVFEKKQEAIGETILVDIAASTFANDGANLDFSRKVEAGCMEDNMKVAGILSLVKEECLYLVFNK